MRGAQTEEVAAFSGARLLMGWHAAKWNGLGCINGKECNECSVTVNLVHDFVTMDTRVHYEEST